ncbi:MAG: ATP-binding cassette domain-containing protein, partial [Spirochaetia bacterium]
IYENPLEVKQLIGYLPENAPVYTDLNVTEYLQFIATARNIPSAQQKERMDEVIDECGLREVRHKEIDKLSKGYRQRVGLAQAIIHDPQILILDEPTTGLDPNQILEIRALIKKLGKEKTVILSTHILQEVEAVCNRVLILNDGEIVAKGTTEEIGRELKGELIMTLLVKPKKADDLGSSLAELPVVKSVLETSALKNGNVSVRLSLESDDEPGAQIFQWAVDKGHVLLSMIPERISLEDIFIKLTQEGGVRNE